MSHSECAVAPRFRLQPVIPGAVDALDFLSAGQRARLGEILRAAGGDLSVLIEQFVDAKVAALLPEISGSARRRGVLAETVLVEGGWPAIGLALHSAFAGVERRRGRHERALLSALERRRAAGLVGLAEREGAVEEFIDLIQALDGIMRGRADRDAAAFALAAEPALSFPERAATQEALLADHRARCIHARAEQPGFLAVLNETLTAAQKARIFATLARLD